MPQVVESHELTTAEIAGVANGRETGLQDSAGKTEEYSEPLLPQDFSGDMKSRWESIQTGFVDDPKTAVQRADELVASSIRKLAETFAEERAKLEQQWSKGNDVSTEDLRQALRRYRAFFQRLLAV